MPMIDWQTVTDSRPKRKAQIGARSRWFYVAISGVLLGIVILGFAPSFFLRPLFTQRPLPVYLYVHGSVLTIWFSLVFVQTCLVAAHRTDLHRRLGVIAIVNAAVLVPISAIVAIRAIPRYVAAGVATSDIQFIVIGDLVSLAVFSLLIAAAVRWRRSPEWHKRLMAVSCIMIVGPAVARLERVGLAVPVPAVLLSLLVVLGIYDFARMRRLHPATVSSAGLVVIAIGAVLLVVGTATGQALIDSLR